jgi:two-component system chemotaxis response regulator CheY
MRVGLLEDDTSIQEMLMLILQDEGYSVTVYSNAQECLDALGITAANARPQPVDLMIIDWRLSGTLSGTEVIQQIHSDPRYSSLPIILTTAATINDIEDLQHLHVALLEKPFSVDEMLALINDLMQPSPSS